MGQGRDDLIVKVRFLLHDKAGDNTLALLELIDQIQRFGIAYHFKEEIGSLLSKLFESYPNLTLGRCSDDDLYMVSLLFRLLRQQGHRASSDVFDVFKDPATGKFRESLAGNVLGVLGLFEAGHMLVPGDDILEEALAFTSTHLESVKEEREAPFIAKLVKQALKQPLRQGYPRVEAWHYIHIYQDDASCNETVLALAKSDFNYLQKLHHKEASDVVRWWKERDFVGHMPFMRDRIVECYLWILSVYFEPEFSFARVFLAKIVAMTSLMDDMFDAYGTLEEQELFTEALERHVAEFHEGALLYHNYFTYAEFIQLSPFPGGT
ncbi:hypothetical protein MLD38_012702 [Melastoma candidum]|uniref:Uncharacterized protein n=1 Tax=Melastoma candidum TaxID=119954 RepID=A0ACB9R6S6_9MYRT|nr:hypothetical protein MLD38_012702 [Melastoma candidum]